MKHFYFDYIMNTVQFQIKLKKQGLKFSYIGLKFKKVCASSMKILVFLNFLNDV